MLNVPEMEVKQDDEELDRIIEYFTKELDFTFDMEEDEDVDPMLVDNSLPSMDDILDKLVENGPDSLTLDERKLLDRYANEYNNNKEENFMSSPLNQEEIQMYLSDIRKIKVMTPEREKELSDMICSDNISDAQRDAIHQELFARKPTFRYHRCQTISESRVTVG